MSCSFIVPRVLAGKAGIVWRSFYSLFAAWNGKTCVFSLLNLGFHMSGWPQDGGIIPFSQVEAVFYGLASEGT